MFLGWLDRLLGLKPKRRPIDDTVRPPTKEELSSLISQRDGWFYDPHLYRRRYHAQRRERDGYRLD